MITSELSGFSTPQDAGEPPRITPGIRTLRRLKGYFLRRVFRAGDRAVRGLWWRMRLYKFGGGSSISSPASIVGGKWIEVGTRVFIWHSARIEALQTDGPDPSICIGDRTVIQPYVHIAAVASIVVGTGVLMASHVYITDHDHDFANPEEDIVCQKRLIVAPVSIGNHVWLGERVIVLKGVSIGDRSVIGAGSIVTRDIPPFSIAVGSPARVVRRYDLASRRWLKVTEP